jgi:hypothetical protein
MEMIFSANSAEKYSCNYCDTICNKKNDWLRHLKTNKHLRNSGNKTEIKKSAKGFTCKCGKKYISNSGLWKHSKLCVTESKQENIQFIKNEPNKQNEIVVPTDISFLTHLVLEVVKNNNELQKQNNEYQKQNQEFQKQMLEVCKNGGTYNSHNNSHNKTFNLQFFLNEQCKDAMNIMDFVNSMTLEFADLEDVGKLGYVEGISKIIIRKLNELDVYKRPIHCSDLKREIMYVKDDNIWEKENSTYDKLRKAIKHVTKKNGDMLIPWSKMYPACMNTSNPLNDTYIRIMGQAMGGKEEFVDSENKIMKKIAKAVIIDK